MWRQSLSATAMLGICLATAPVVALGVATAPLQETVDVFHGFSEHLSNQAVDARSAGPVKAPPIKAPRSARDGSPVPVSPEPVARRSTPVKPATVKQPKPSQSSPARTDSIPPAPITVLPVRTDAPHCEDVYVYIVTDAIDGAAVATLGLGQKARGRPRRVGHRLGEYEVIAIGSLGVGRGPGVWLNKGKEVCVAPLSADNPLRKRKIRAAAAKAKREAKRAAKRAAKRKKAKKRRKAKRRARRRR